MSQSMSEALKQEVADWNLFDANVRVGPSGIHGELALEQLFFQRPAPHYSDYRSPVRGLYQCGSSTHPGGGVSGIPGHNAAREILRDWKRLPSP